MRKFGLIGFPLSHSFSSRYFSKKFSNENIKGCEYVNFPIKSINELPLLLDSHPDLCGLNVTIPYKEQVLPFLAFQDEVVAKVGACNCISIEKDGLHGFNTDVIGFESSLQIKLIERDKKALILGTGGAAKAVAFVLKKLSIHFKFVSRDEKKNTLTYDQLSRDTFLQYSIIINTTPIGMYPADLEKPPLNYAGITDQHYLFDLIYNPLKTKFLEMGEMKGARIQNGIKMLEIQAEESWKVWNGK